MKHSGFTNLFNLSELAIQSVVGSQTTSSSFNSAHRIHTKYTAVCIWVCRESKNVDTVIYWLTCSFLLAQLGLAIHFQSCKLF